MPLSIEDRWVGDVAVVVCSGRIVEGPEVSALERHVLGLTAETRHVVLHVGGVDFLDSSGIGLLVRLHARLQNAAGGLSLCAVPPKMREVLKVTRLHRILEPHESEAEAIAAAFRAPQDLGAAEGRKGVLCVHRSADVLAYVRELLRSAGYAVVCAANLPDALTLLTATQPGAVVIGRDLRAARDTRAAATFNERADAVPVLEIPQDFSTGEAGDAGLRLVDRLKGLIGLSGDASAAPIP